MSDDSLKLDKDFYYNPNRKMVLTSAFLKRRGYCCKSGCLHCPYGYLETANPDVPPEFQQNNHIPGQLPEDYEKYLEQAEELEAKIK